MFSSATNCSYFAYYVVLCDIQTINQDGSRGDVRDSTNFVYFGYISPGYTASVSFCRRNFNMQKVSIQCFRHRHHVYIYIYFVLFCAN